LWRHAGDYILTVSEVYRPADHMRVAAEIILPYSVTDHDDTRSTGPVIGGADQPPQFRRHSKQREELAGDEASIVTMSAQPVADRELAIADSRNGGKTVHVREVHIVRVTHRVGGHTRLRRRSDAIDHQSLHLV